MGQSMTRASARLRTLDMAYIALFAVLMAVCAWITVPMTVPFTMQTFAVFAALCVLGGRRGLYAVAVYLLLGLVGLPVFSSFQSTGALLGPTGGYLVGFLMAALVYWAVTARLGESLPVVILGCVLVMVTYYVFGTIWFMIVYARTTGPVGLLSALSWCVFPFIVPDLVKLGLAVTLGGKLRRHLK